MQIKIYVHGNKKFALIDGNLFAEVEQQPLISPPPAAPDETPKAVVLIGAKRGRKAKVKTAKIKKTKTGVERRGAKRFTPEEREKMMDAIRGGIAHNDFIEKFNSSSANYYKLKGKVGKTSKVDEQDPAFDQAMAPEPSFQDPHKHKYQCMSGHTFMSTLKQSEARCPEKNCYKKVFREIKE